MFELLLFTSMPAERVVHASDIASVSLQADTCNGSPPQGTTWRVLLSQQAMRALLTDIAAGRPHQLIDEPVWHGPYD